MLYGEILKKFKSLYNPEAVKGMARYGINPEKSFGVSIPTLRNMAKETGENHILAAKLWESGIHEGRILASMIDDPEMVTEEQAETWVKDFNSWDVCDQCCMNLFGNVKFVSSKCSEWSSRKEEFVKRAGFALMAVLSVHDKKAEDKEFVKFLQIIKRESTDDRNYVRKAVNWALRNIGKRNLNLNKTAIKTAKEIQRIDSKTAKWIASDAIKELISKAVQKRIKK